MHLYRTFCLGTFVRAEQLGRSKLLTFYWWHSRKVFFLSLLSPPFSSLVGPKTRPNLPTYRNVKIALKCSDAKGLKYRICLEKISPSVIGLYNRVIYSSNAGLQLKLKWVNCQHEHCKRKRDNLRMSFCWHLRGFFYRWDTFSSLPFCISPANNGRFREYVHFLSWQFSLAWST